MSSPAASSSSNSKKGDDLYYLTLSAIDAGAEDVTTLEDDQLEISNTVTK